jgi:hypothetical protein
MDALFEALSFLDDNEEDPDMYIVGGESTWSLTEPMSKMTNLGNGIYVDTVTISTPIYFVFADGGPDIWKNDWTAFNGNYRYGPASTTTITTGTSYTTAKRNNNASYYFTGDGSDYLFTFDLNNLSFKLEVVEVTPPVELGDVNDDGFINVNDVTTLIAYILGKPVEVFNANNADIDGDSKFNVNDVTRLIAMILKH